MDRGHRRYPHQHSGRPSGLVWVGHRVAGTDGEEALLGNRADVFVEDLWHMMDMTKHRIPSEPLPSALGRFASISREALGKALAVFLDYDGTLTPIVERPEQAVMSEDMRKVLTELSWNCRVAIISGRDLADVRDRVRIDSLVYAGSHGFDISGPKGWRIDLQMGTEFLPLLDRAEARLIRDLAPIEGLRVERKKFAIAVHYRLVDPGNLHRIEKIVGEIAVENPKLRMAYGKKVFELQPNIDWHKGKALLALLWALKLEGKDVLPFYIGDDVTDEDAFRAIRGWGIGIVVREEPFETSALYSLKNPDEVREFLRRLTLLSQRSR